MPIGGTREQPGARFLQQRLEAASAAAARLTPPGALAEPPRSPLPDGRGPASLALRRPTRAGGFPVRGGSSSGSWSPSACPSPAAAFLRLAPRRSLPPGCQAIPSSSGSLPKRGRAVAYNGCHAKYQFKKIR